MRCLRGSIKKTTYLAFGYRAVLAGLFAWCGLLAPRVAQAHHGENLSIDALTRRAAVIVEGQVTAINSAWNAAQTQIHTTVTLKVMKYHKGDLNKNTIEIKFLGGTVGNITMAVLGQPEFTLNEEAFLFLMPNHETRDIPFVGGEEGKFTVVKDPATGVEELRSTHRISAKSAAVELIERIMQAITTAQQQKGGK